MTDFEISLEVEGYDELLTRFEKAGAEIEPRMRQHIIETGFTVETRIKANASGRPGPNVVTGDYRRSWTTQHGATPDGGYEAVVGTNRPQGPRLEFGFHDVDSLGRHYDQPPYPHVAPAVAQTEPEFIEGAAEIVEESLS